MKKHAFLRKKGIPAAAFLLGILLLTGAGLSHNDPILNPEERPVYEAVPLSELAKSGAYEGCDIVTAGNIGNISPERTSFTISDEGSSLKVTLTTAKPLIGLYEGDRIYLYGRKTSDHISGDHAVKGSRSGLRDQYYLWQGNSYSDSDTTERTLGDGKITYRIPKEWSYAELKGTQKEELIHMDEGDCDGYLINALTGAGQAECFFIFHFDSDRYLKYDSDKAEIYGIERSIIENICPEENLSWNSFAHYAFPTLSVHTSYGRTFDHYVAVFRSHRAEFVFTETSDGLCVLLYVYNGEMGASDDILYLMRTLETS